MGDAPMAMRDQQRCRPVSAGDVSEPVRSGDGYRILKVEARTEASVVPFEEVKESIRRSLYEKRMTKELASYIAGLREKAIINVMVREVPQELEGGAVSTPSTLREPQPPSAGAAASEGAGTRTTAAATARAVSTTRTRPGPGSATRAVLLMACSLSPDLRVGPARDMTRGPAGSRDQCRAYPGPRPSGRGV